MGALKIEVRGTQNHRFTQADFAQRFRDSFGMSMPAPGAPHTAHTVASAS
jgi:hypothetical protein